MAVVFLVLKYVFLYRYFGFYDFLIYYVGIPLLILVIAGLNIRFSENYASLGQIFKTFLGILSIGIFIDFLGTVYLAATLTLEEKNEITLNQGILEPSTNFFNNLNQFNYQAIEVHSLVSISGVIPDLILTFIFCFSCSLLPAFLIRKEQHEEV